MSWFDFFGKDPRDIFLEFSPLNSHWRVVSWNFDLKDPAERLWTVEVHGTSVSSIEWSRLQHDELQFFRNQKLIRKRRVTPAQIDLKELMNLSVHSTLKYSLESNHEFLLTPVSGATTLDFQNEARALQWIQASFGTLMRALDSMQGRPELILTAALFSGQEPSSGQNVLRIMAFNLDIFCYFQPDFSLQIAIFDDKNLGHGGAKTPSFQQIIKVTKPQIYDEIVKLVHRIATVGEIS
jgi:hypothetical protein